MSQLDALAENLAQALAVLRRAALGGQGVAVAPAGELLHQAQLLYVARERGLGGVYPPLAQCLHELVLRLNIPARDNFEYDVLSR